MVHGWIHEISSTGTPGGTESECNTFSTHSTEKERKEKKHLHIFHSNLYLCMKMLCGLCALCRYLKVFSV